MPDDVKAIRRRADQAYQDKMNWSSLYDDLYRYVLPLRRPARPATGAIAQATPVGRGEPRGQHAYDLTAPKAAFRFAGRMERDVTPLYQRFFELKLGPAAREAVASHMKLADAREIDDVIARGNQELERITNMVIATLEGSNFPLAIGEMYLDLFGGQGALLMLEDDDTLIDFVAVPASEPALREDGRGRVVAVYWKRQYRAGDLPGMWKRDAETFSDELSRLIENTPDAMVDICQATEWDAKTRTWTFTAYRDGGGGEDEGPIYRLEGMRTSPWLTPRFYKVPGEAHGRGPGLMALPTIKTLNKVTELTLKAAAFAILGLWMYRNDRVFNPNTATMRPGAFWKVSTTGGPLGPGIQKLDVPGRFDISNIVLQDLRQMVKEATFDDTLPPDSGAVRSATEIVERLKRLYSDLSGAYARLVLEIVKPLVQRVIDVLHRRGLIQGDLPIDQILYRLEIVSPIARQQQAQDVSALVDWLQILLGTMGREGAMLTAKMEDIGAEIGRKLGIPERLIRTTQERGQLMQMIATIIAEAQMQGQGGAPAAPAAGQAAA